MDYNKASAKREAQVARYGKQTHYAVLPTSGDEQDFFDSVHDMSYHKLKRNKLPLVPVFKDWNQRKQFYNSAVARRDELTQELKGLPRKKGKDLRVQLRAADHLVNTSWGGHLGTGVRATVRTNLSDTPSESPRVYVFGHGSPGSDELSDGTNVKSVARTLRRLGLPATSDVRVNSCWSGAGADIRGRPKGELRDAFLAGTLPAISAPDKSFAAQLHTRLRDKGFQGKTSGYIGSVGFGNDKALLRNGKVGRHFVTTLRDDLVVRRSHARVTFDK